MQINFDRLEYVPTLHIFESFKWHIYQQKQSHREVAGVDGGQTELRTVTPQTKVQLHSLMCG